MAVYEVSCNLSSALFSFATEMWGRSIMFPQYDENYNRTIFSTVDPGFEKEIPQIYYMHNVMPTVEGYQSIGYDTAIAATPPATGAFGSFVFGTSGFGVSASTSFIYDQIYQVQTADANNFLFVPAAGLNFIYDASVGSWKSINPFASGTVPTNVQVTTAFVQGQTYIYYANFGCFLYNDATKQLVSVTLAGLDPTQIVSICAANGYMIATSKNAVAWSSLTNPIDFTPSIITGAGGGSVNDAKGLVIVGLQITGGFIIYCQYNAVGATYTGNSNFPFIFLEIAGSGGTSDMNKISYHANMATHIALTSYGMQEISKTLAKAVYPEATDFLAAKIFEDFDETTNAFSVSYTTSQLAAKIVIIEARFIVISYGVTAPMYTHALVYDMTLKRWGKLKLAHSACFEYNAPNTFGSTTYGALINTTYAQLATTTYGDLSTQAGSVVLPKKSLAFLQKDGTVLIVNFDQSEATADGVFMIGKFQFMRRKWIQHQYGLIDTINKNNNFKYFVIPTFDGKTLQPFVAGFLNTKFSGPKNRLYQKVVSGQNISVMFQGQFALSTFVLGFTVMGNR